MTHPTDKVIQTFLFVAKILGHLFREKDTPGKGFRFPELFFYPISFRKKNFDPPSDVIKIGFACNSVEIATPLPSNTCTDR